MKITAWTVGYTAVMILLLFFLSHCLQNGETEGRDMVYYNEQSLLLQKAIGQTGAETLSDRGRETLQQTYGCDILFLSDDDYQLRLDAALREEALVVDYMVSGTLVGKFIWHTASLHYRQMERGLSRRVYLMWGVILCTGYLLLGIIYVRLLRPFHKLQFFSRQIAKGNLEVPLPMQKNNYFGAFTESFDLMREELKRARDSEYQANRSKKELVAELSHDIKTPVSTIRATCEVLQLKEQNADTQKKIAIIDAKARMVDELVDNLFQASLEELSVLKVTAAEESSRCIGEMFEELWAYGDITLENACPECLVYMDRLRMQQVIDNCLNNSWKYAGTPVTVHFAETDGGIRIKIKDSGPGVPADELPLITEKFYRGANAKGKAGSGLGLYLSRLFLEQMKGGLEYYNEEGFVVELFLRKV